VLQLRGARIGEVERNPDHRLLGRAAPFVRQVARRVEVMQPLLLQLTIELLDLRGEVRPFQLQSQLPDGNGEAVHRLARRLFERAHRCNRAMKYWLMKVEPTAYSIDDLKRDGTTRWDGARNYQARNFMRDMRAGDKVLFYASSADPSGVTGLAEVSREA